MTSTTLEKFTNAQLDSPNCPSRVGNCAAIVSQGSGAGICSCGAGLEELGRDRMNSGTRSEEDDRDLLDLGLTGEKRSPSGHTSEVSCSNWATALPAPFRRTKPFLRVDF